MFEKPPSPNLFIVGAPKAGTTSLYQLLKDHPEVFMSPVKEPNHLSTDIDTSAFKPIFKKHLVKEGPYFKQKNRSPVPVMFVRDRKNYESLFHGTGHYRWRGEASTSYMYSGTAASNIHHLAPSARIIVMLRDPVERAYSHYRMAYQDGFVKGTFREAVLRDIKREKKGWGVSELFIEQGKYYEQLRRYFKIFPRERIFIGSFRKMKEEPGEFLRELADFLGIDFDEGLSVPTENPTEEPKAPILNRIMLRSGLRQGFKKLLPHPLKAPLKKRFYETALRGGPSDEDRALLFPYFREDIQKTRELLGWSEAEQPGGIEKAIS